MGWATRASPALWTHRKELGPREPRLVSRRLGALGEARCRSRKEDLQGGLSKPPRSLPSVRATVGEAAPGKGEAGRAQEAVGLPYFPRKPRSSFRAELKSQLGRGEGGATVCILAGGWAGRRAASLRGPSELQDSNMDLMWLLRRGGGH